MKAKDKRQPNEKRLLFQFFLVNVGLHALTIGSLLYLRVTRVELICLETPLVATTALFFKWLWNINQKKKAPAFNTTTEAVKVKVSTPSFITQ